MLKMPTSQGCYQDEMIFFVKGLEQCLHTVKARQEFNIIKYCWEFGFLRNWAQNRVSGARDLLSNPCRRKKRRKGGRIKHEKKTKVRMWSQLGSGCTLWNTNHTTLTLRQRRNRCSMGRFLCVPLSLCLQVEKVWPSSIGEFHFPKLILEMREAVNY